MGVEFEVFTSGALNKQFSRHLHKLVVPEREDHRLPEPGHQKRMVVVEIFYDLYLVLGGVGVVEDKVFKQHHPVISVDYTQLEVSRPELDQ